MSPTPPAATSKLPGVALCLLAAAAAYAVNLFVPALSALLVAILAGVVLTNLISLPAVLSPGLALSARRLLRIGIVLLGLQLVLTDIVDLGLGMIFTVIAVVSVGMLATLWLGSRLGIRRPLTVLIAAGFSICGAAAVAAIDGVIEDDEEDVVTALALVVAFGTVMIPLIPVLGRLLGLSEQAHGMWAGGSIHEVAQVVAAAGTVGAAALKVGVVVKLARVLMLAPIIAFIVVAERRDTARSVRGAHSATGGTIAPTSMARPPLVPLFVAGFLAMAVVRTSGMVPTGVLDVAKIVQTILLAAAMFALGCGVKAKTLRAVGGRPVLLGAATTTIIMCTALAGVHFFGNR